MMKFKLKVFAMSSVQHCLGRFLGIDPSVSKSNRLHINIFRILLINLRYIPWIPLKWWAILLKYWWTSTSYFSNSTGSSVTSGRFSLFFGVQKPIFYLIARDKVCVSVPIVGALISIHRAWLACWCDNGLQSVSRTWGIKQANSFVNEVECTDHGWRKINSIGYFWVKIVVHSWI